jgi:hypothetical protein
MSTICDSIQQISDDIQSTFEHLIKLVIRKTLRPTLNPLSNNEKTIYNPFTGHYERAFIGNSPDDSVTKYNYHLTQQCLGWVGDYITTFKLTAKYMKNTFPKRKPAATNRYSKLTNVAVAYNNRTLAIDDANPTNLFRAAIENVIGKNMLGIIANRRGEFAYTSDVSYTDCWKQLNSIGNDIINQTDASIPPHISARMSTAMLRVHLYALEQHLALLAAAHPSIFESYQEMVELINSHHQSKVTRIINLIGVLSYREWESLSQREQDRFIIDLGTDFIDRFNSNELITVLLQCKSPQLILTSSYLYSLLKMLFVVFGFNSLEPIQADPGNLSTNNFRTSHLQNHYDRFSGARLLRNPDDTDTDMNSDDGSSVCTDTESVCSSRTDNCEPPDQCIVDYIKMFCRIYPTITGIMGGCDCFPDECKQLDCNNIPNNYHGLDTINDFLWRYQDFAYCRYLDVVNSKIVTNALQAKIDDKVRYLKTV